MQATTNTIEQVWFTAVGMRFRKSKPSDLQTAAGIRLQSEPNNQIDPQAIKVLIENAEQLVHVGYVSKKETARVKPFLEKNYKIIVLDTYPQSVQLCLEVVSAQ